MTTKYHDLVAEVDRMTAVLTARYQTHLQCRAGCSGCCHHHLSVFQVEADAIARAIQQLSVSQRNAIEEQARTVVEREKAGLPVSCPLLVEDRCSIYEQRPIICRTQGLPILLGSDDDELEVDWCPLNFTADGAAEDLDEAHLIPLDRLNMRLALVNLDHCRERAISDAASGNRITIAEIVSNARLSEPR